jgi:hypothetical protein
MTSSPSPFWLALSKPYRHYTLDEPDFQPCTSPYDLPGRVGDPQHLPCSIAKNVLLVPTMLENLKLYCEGNPNSVNDRDHIRSIDYKRETACSCRLSTDATDFEKSLEDPLEDILRMMGHDTYPDVDSMEDMNITGVQTTYFQQRPFDDDEPMDDIPMLVIMLGVNWLTGNAFYPAMDHKADTMYGFDEKTAYFEDEDSVAVKVR